MIGKGVIFYNDSGDVKIIGEPCVNGSKGIYSNPTAYFSGRGICFMGKGGIDMANMLTDGGFISEDIAVDTGFAETRNTMFWKIYNRLAGIDINAVLPSRGIGDGIPVCPDLVDPAEDGNMYYTRFEDAPNFDDFVGNMMDRIYVKALCGEKYDSLDSYIWARDDFSFVCDYVAYCGSRGNES